MELPSLTGYGELVKANENRYTYYEWLNGYIFLNSCSELSWIDIDLLARSIMSGNKLEFDDTLYTDLCITFRTKYMSSNNKIKAEYKDIGYLAFKFFTKVDQWVGITHNSSRLELFIRCLEYNFKNSRETKDYILEYKKNNNIL